MPFYGINKQAPAFRSLLTLKMAVNVCAVAGVLVAPYVIAQENDHHGRHGEHSAAEQHGDNPAVAAYQAASDRMHEDMAMALTGNPDVDFAQGMIPHHEGAIAMAEIVLEYGEDDEIRQLAEEIIAAQEDEIAFLKEWLARKKD
ncbi:MULTISPECIES: CopM family metallochaperone [unclassified Halomonas]|uniref:CopM family metallochaperone n=1 Tax=unclassified Halomonas TaxID=2609666 RepID=UPI0006DA55A0|nr:MULTISPECIES: DUF305 domain-containing protein [unclassified Halomonas]KPQ22429.1 MAG: hypothetical protein HLUCCO06_04055 [Halomonas sp. HL-93]SBR50598.1 protein of unknown function (DUF305) [Halomonas sp. HL-93]SNY96938.1 protein of unknown function [Halomonas sp. hl-4]